MSAVLKDGASGVPRIIWPAGKRKELRAMAKEPGATVQSCAARLGLPLEEVRSVAGAMRLPLRRGFAGVDWPARAQQVRELSSHGKTREEILRVLAFSESSLRIMCRRFSIPLPPLATVKPTSVSPWPWTPELETLLRDNYPTLSGPELAERIGYPVNVVKARIRRLRLKGPGKGCWGPKGLKRRKPKPLERDEIERVIASYKAGTPVADIAVAHDRNPGTISALLHSRGLSLRSHRWTKEEVELLRTLWATTDDVVLAKRFRRPAQAIRAKAGSIGLPPRPRRLLYSTEMVAEIRKDYEGGKSVPHICKKHAIDEDVLLNLCFRYGIVRLGVRLQGRS